MREVNWKGRDLLTQRTYRRVCCAIGRGVTSEKIMSRTVRWAVPYVRKRPLDIMCMVMTCGRFPEGVKYIVVTGRLDDFKATTTAFNPLKEDNRALDVKRQMSMGDVEFVTVPVMSESSCGV
jgi:hypothetical protein